MRHHYADGTQPTSNGQASSRSRSEIQHLFHCMILTLIAIFTVTDRFAGNQPIDAVIIKLKSSTMKSLSLRPIRVWGYQYALGISGHEANLKV